MPITQFLNGERYDPETKRVLGVAFEMTCIALRPTAPTISSNKPSPARSSISLKPVSAIPIFCASKH